MAIELNQRDGIWQISGTGPDGKRIRRSCKTRDRRKAEELKAKIEARLWESHVYGAEKVKTFDEAALEYAQNGGEMRFIMEPARHFKDVKLAQITPKMIRDGAKAIYPHAKASTRNRQFITPARSVINFAHEQGWCNQIRVNHFKEETPKRIFVERDYIDALIPHCSDRLAALILFLNQTGRRVGEALQIQQEHIDFKNLTIHIEKTKNGKPFTCHITTELAKRLVDLNKSPIFGISDKSAVAMALKRASRRAGLPYVTSHQLGRHSFGATLWREGWDPKRIADAGGWETPRLVEKTYAHATPLTKEAAEIMASKRNMK